MGAGAVSGVDICGIPVCKRGEVNPNVGGPWGAEPRLPKRGSVAGKFDKPSGVFWVPSALAGATSFCGSGAAFANKKSLVCWGAVCCWTAAGGSFSSSWRPYFEKCRTYKNQKGKINEVILVLWVKIQKNRFNEGEYRNTSKEKVTNLWTVMMSRH